MCEKFLLCFYIIANLISLGWGPLVRQYESFEDIALDFRNCDFNITFLALSISRCSGGTPEMLY